MIADIEKIPVSEKKEEIVEKDDYLTKRKIKVNKVEPTKNQKKPAPVRKKVNKEETKITFKPELTQTIELTQIIPTENKRLKIERPVTEDIKDVRKKDLEDKKETKSKKKLNLNPTTIKTVTRSGKKKVEVEEPEKEIKVEINRKPIEEPKVKVEVEPKVTERKITVEVEEKKPTKVEPFITMDDFKEEEAIETKPKKKYPPLVEIRKIR